MGRVVIIPSFLIIIWCVFNRQKHPVCYFLKHFPFFSSNLHHLYRKCTAIVFRSSAMHRTQAATTAEVSTLTTPLATTAVLRIKATCRSRFYLQHNKASNHSHICRPRFNPLAPASARCRCPLISRWTRRWTVAAIPIPVRTPPSSAVIRAGAAAHIRATTRTIVAAWSAPVAAVRLTRAVAWELAPVHPAPRCRRCHKYHHHHNHHHHHHHRSHCLQHCWVRVWMRPIRRRW